MSELESTIEKELIAQLTKDESQWTYRPDITTENALWANIRKILEANNKDVLNGTSLTDQEFEQVKNQLSFPSFYDAAVWIAGDNGKAMVHVQRGNKVLHLIVLSRVDKAGGSSVYEVINQYKPSKDEIGRTRNRRFDVTLLINGLPLIHIELKNRENPYMDAFWQIKNYIHEGKFRGVFSCVQMFVVSNAVDTKYIAPAMDSELNENFLCGWIDEENNAVPDYLDFAKQVLRVPEAHQMITQYVVLDNKAKKVILLRPYQIHAIKAIREASKRGESGFIWHTTGSGKTLTSYKVARNLLQDIPSINKTIFLIDRKALDAQTTQAFQSYAANDIVDVDETDNVKDLLEKLSNDNQQMIVTTIQKLHIVMKRLHDKEDTPLYKKIQSKRIAFVVDECHRTVTPETQRTLKTFFINSLWYGFTGTPIFKENAHKAQGDLPRTTEDMFGKALQKYTIKHAIHDQTVLRFSVEYRGYEDNKDKYEKIYVTRKHRLMVLDVILNQCEAKLGINNGIGKSYEGMLTTDSIPHAQEYYSLLKEVKAGTHELRINPDFQKRLKDYPKFAITYSISENGPREIADQAKMQEALDDYNSRFGTKFDMSQLDAYNSDLSDRLARKESRYKDRDEQLDFVIVVDRLLTGFDAPCLSTVFVDRPVMLPHDIIQMFSRTNRLYDGQKIFGHIVTFRSAHEWKKNVDEALRLYSDGGESSAIAPEWNDTEADFIKAINRLKETAANPEIIPELSIAGKKSFAHSFQIFDKLYASAKSFTNWAGHSIEDYGLTKKDYDNYVAQYKNVMEELKEKKTKLDENDDEILDIEYVLLSYEKAVIDYEYILDLMQEFVNDDRNSNLARRQKKIAEIEDHIKMLSNTNAKLGELMRKLLDNILNSHKENFHNKRVTTVLEEMRNEAITRCVEELCETWCLDSDSVWYAVDHYHGNETIPNIQEIKKQADYNAYKAKTGDTITKLDYRVKVSEAVKKKFIEEIGPLQQQEM